MVFSYDSVESVKYMFSYRPFRHFYVILYARYLHFILLCIILDTHLIKLTSSFKILVKFQYSASENDRNLPLVKPAGVYNAVSTPLNNTLNIDLWLGHCRWSLQVDCSVTACCYAVKHFNLNIFLSL